MAKIGKEKFSVDGARKGRTVYKGQIELDLYYEAAKNYFFFKEADMEPYFEKSAILSESLFVSCDTRLKAINTFKFLLDDNSIKTKMIAIQIAMPAHLFTVPNPAYSTDRWKQETIINPELPEYLHKMITDSFYQQAGLSIMHKRYMKIESNGIVIHSEADENWDYKVGRGNSDIRYGLIEWTEEREMFLIGIQRQMDAMCKKVLDFFKAKDIAELCSKIESNTKLLA